MTKFLRVTAATLLALIATTRAMGVSGQVQIVEQVLVKVNGDIITKSELEERQINALRQRNINPDVLKDDEQLKKALAEVTPQILVNAIDEMLLLQVGKEKGLRLSDEQFNRWLSSMRKEQNLEDDKRFQEALKQEGMTITDVRRNVERQFLIQEVQRDEFGGKLQITEEEARQVLSLAREGVHRSRIGHAARDSHRGANGDPAGAARDQRRSGRSGVEEGRSGARAAGVRRRLCQAGG